MSMLITQTFAPTGIRTRDPKNVRQPHYRCAIRVVRSSIVVYMLKFILQIRKKKNKLFVGISNHNYLHQAEDAHSYSFIQGRSQITILESPLHWQPMNNRLPTLKPTMSVDFP